MRFFRQDEVPEDEHGLLCRQSRLAGVLRLIVWCSLLAVPMIFGWRLGKLWLLWTFVALAAILIPMALIDLAAQFRTTNWLMRVGRDGVWVNLRSYRDRDNGLDAPSAVRLDYGEIASVGRHTESYTTPSERATSPGSYGKVGGSTGWRDEFLEIQLNHDQTGELKTVLNSLRFPPAPAEQSSPQMPVHPRISPVWFVNPSLLRIGWLSNHGPATLPRLVTALSSLETNVLVAEPTRGERPDWRVLTSEQVHELARELVHVHGATLEATTLLVRAGGMSNGEANAEVQQYELETIQ